MSSLCRTYSTKSSLPKDMMNYLSNLLEHIFIDGILEFHPTIEWVLLIVGDQFRHAVKSGRANRELAVLFSESAMANLVLSSAEEGIVERR